MGYHAENEIIQLDLCEVNIHILVRAGGYLKMRLGRGYKECRKEGRLSL